MAQPVGRPRSWIRAEVRQIVAHVWTDEAMSRFEDIYAWVASDKPEAAARLAHRLIVAGDTLETMPTRGREIASGVRQLAILAPYLLRYAYDPASDVVVIYTIWHGAREEP